MAYGVTCGDTKPDSDSNTHRPAVFLREQSKSFNLQVFCRLTATKAHGIFWQPRQAPKTVTARMTDTGHCACARMGAYEHA